MNQSHSKKCFKCDVEKPMSEFYKHQQMGDGTLNKCKECAKNDVNTHRKNNIERIREYDRKRGNRQDSDYLRKYRENNPEKYKATGMVHRAIRSGRLKKKVCEVCGLDKNIHAHHPDYSKPLDVVWLCCVCHNKEHPKTGTV